MNTEMIAYYEIMNTLDDLALNNKPLMLPDIIKLHALAKENDLTIEDIADANNCGECHEWNELLAALKEQFSSGERVPVESSESVDYLEGDLPEDTLSVLQDLYTEAESLYAEESGGEDYDTGLKDGISSVLDLIEKYYDILEAKLQ